MPSHKPEGKVPAAAHELAPPIQRGNRARRRVGRHEGRVAIHPVVATGLYVGIRGCRSLPCSVLCACRAGLVDALQLWCGADALLARLALLVLH
jgi:hypothetical protein